MEAVARARAVPSMAGLDLAKLGSDAVVEIIPNRDHSTVLDVKLAERLDREMQEAIAIVYPSRREDPK